MNKLYEADVSQLFLHTEKVFHFVTKQQAENDRRKQKPPDTARRLARQH